MQRSKIGLWLLVSVTVIAIGLAGWMHTNGITAAMNLGPSEIELVN